MSVTAPGPWNAWVYVRLLCFWDPEFLRDSGPDSRRRLKGSSLMHATSSSSIRRQTPSTGRHPLRWGFSLTELLVVIGIIVLLVGILLVALAKVRQRAMRAETEARMNQFGNACTAFEAEPGRYPGVIPDGELAAHEAANGACPISCTENALLHLMGNYRLLSPSDDPAGSIADDYDAFYPTSIEEIQIEGTLG